MYLVGPICILRKDFLQALAKRINKNTTLYENYHRSFVPEGHPLKGSPKESLRVNVLFEHIHNESHVILFFIIC